MVRWLGILLGTLRSTIRTHRELALENLALRQQLAVWKARQPRPRLTAMDRIFWVVLSRLWKGWRNSLQVVRPETVVGWHRQGFRRYWAWKSRRRRGRPAIRTELRDLIRRMSRANPLWGAPRIHGERRLVHFNVTEHPSSDWTGRQLIEACGLEEAPRHLIRDRDQVYGERFSRQARTLDIREVVIAPRSPWQNAYAERVIGLMRRECLDHVVVIGERHLLGILSKYVDYYNGTRTHLSLAKDAPEPRSVQPPSQGSVVDVPRVGGLHHEYLRRAA